MKTTFLLCLLSHNPDIRVLDGGIWISDTTAIQILNKLDTLDYLRSWKGWAEEMLYIQDSIITTQQSVISNYMIQDSLYKLKTEKLEKDIQSAKWKGCLWGMEAGVIGVLSGMVIGLLLKP
jgi:hypothetical protein